MTKNEQYELESMLYEIDYLGFVSIKLEKLFRLLGKGSRAAGTWRALVEVWEGIDGNPADLHAAELPNGVLLITNKPLDPLTTWTGEK